MEHTENFYKDLPAFSKFDDVADFSRYVPAPQDWHVVLTDIRGSTKAVEAGKGKDVNTVGVSSIIAVLNAAGQIDIPFVFGGDGATLLIPPSLVEKTKGALVSARNLASRYFDMELRIGIVPIAHLPPGSQVLVAKFKQSPHYFQGIFAGNGVAAAEKLLKHDDTAAIYAIASDFKPSGKFGGFECRWSDIPSPQGETLSVLVKAVTGDIAQDSEVYREVIRAMHDAYGSEIDYHPVTVEGLHLITDIPRLNAETHIRAGHKNALARFWYRTKIWFTDIYFNWAMKTNRTKNDFNLALYKNLLVATCDYRKFDDALRTVITGTQEAREQFTRVLERLHADRKLVYGIHVSDRALMTCLVFERYGKQVHFVDAADGGYTAASKGFKEQLKALTV